ncbi:Acyl-coenzyme A diphosphatase FITM2 [Dirofilaria immitis]
MITDNRSLIATRENYSSQIIFYSRFLQMGLALFILLLLASAHSVPMNNLLWLVALATLSGSIFAQLANYLPSVLTMQMNYLYIYDLLMTISTAVCVPISTYCTSYQMKDDESSTLYIDLALLYIFLATSFLLSLLIRYDFDPYGKNSRSEVLRSTARSDEQRSLLSAYCGYGNYQAF